MSQPHARLHLAGVVVLLARRSSHRRRMRSLYQLHRKRCTVVERCSSRSTHFRSLPPCPFKSTQRRIPWAASESTRSVITRATVDRVQVHRQRETSSGWSRCRRASAGSSSTRAPSLVRERAGPLGDRLDLERVGAVRQVEVVRLGRPQRQHRHLERRVRLDLTVIELVEPPWLHRASSVQEIDSMHDDCMTHASRKLIRGWMRSSTSTGSSGWPAVEGHCGWRGWSVTIGAGRTGPVRIRPQIQFIQGTAL